MQQLGANGPPAVIVGLEGNGLGVARSLRHGGVRTIALADPAWNPAFLTGACEVRRLPAWNKDSLISALRVLGPELGAAVPLFLTKDEAVMWISEARDEVLGTFKLPLPEHESVRRLIDKHAFHRWATEAGWPVPRSWLVNNGSDLNDIVAQITFPALVKPQLKNDAYRRSWLRKAYRAQSESELREVYTKMAQHEPAAIIQEWIEGGDDRIAFVLGYWNAESKPLALFYGRKVRQWPRGFGNTAHAEPAPAEWSEAMEPITAQIAREAKFKGLNSVEFKIEAGTGRPVVTEPTVCRTDYQSEVAVLNGVNLPLIAYADAAGLPIPGTHDPSRAKNAVTSPVKWIDGRADLKSSCHAYCAGELTPGDWIRSMRGPKSFLYFRWSDPLPWLGGLIPPRLMNKR